MNHNEDMEILTTKLIIERMMFEKLESLMPELSAYQKRQISLALSEIAAAEVKKTNADIQKSLSDLTLEYEQNRKKHRTTIDEIQEQAKNLMANMKKEGLITYKTNPKTKKTELIGRSDVLTSVVKFLNAMNDVVIEFYEKVYKIKEDKDTRTKLFD